jgi:tRNA(Ile)-lysidine synthase
MTLRERFDRRLAALAPPPGAALIAVSGGPDSLVLLDLLAGSPAAGQLSLHVAHADHGIHPDSGTVAEQVRAAAGRYRIPVHVGRLALGATASETTARTARYRWLNQLATELAAESIFTAHHQDDQVETILMRLLRGSGPAGLAGIPARRGRVLRPLLPFRREELAEHLHEIGLTAWQDPANRDPRHHRSWLRTELLPMLRRRMPEVDRRILLVGRQAAAHRAVMDAMLEGGFDLDLRVEEGGVSVAAPPLSGYDSGVVRALLGALGRRAGCLVGPTRAARIERLLSRDRSGAVAELGSGFLAELTFGRLRLFRGSVHPPRWERVLIQGEAGRARAGEWTLEWTRDRAPDRLERNPDAGWFVESAYVARPWQPGDRIRPVGGPGRRLVVRCMQDARIARTRRAEWPVIEEGGVVVWVPGVCRSADRIPEPGTLALRINAHLG